jgi:Protein of unknown function (DUF995)
MKRFASKLLWVVYVLALVGFVPQATAQEEKLQGAQILEKGKKLSADVVKTMIVAESEVEHVTATGTIRRWKNNANGKFIASNRSVGGRPGSVTGHGEWNLTENGDYCVSIEWRSAKSVSEEKWCRTLWQVGDIYFLAPANLSPANESHYGTIKVSK